MTYYTKNETIKALTETHQKAADLYRQLADSACNDHNAFEVYFNIKASFAEEAKARKLKQFLIVEV